MNKFHCMLLFISASLITVVITKTAPASPAGPSPKSSAAVPFRVSHPVDTPFGIVFTDEMGASLYLMHDDTTEELFSAPGCGMYFTLSPDGSTIGFKDIFSNGTQAPALLDIQTKKVTLLHSSVPQAGQVSFSESGAIAYSVGDEVFIQDGSTTTQIPVGTYSNIVAISSDGSKIAYNDGRGYIYVLDVRTERSTSISDAGCMLPLWSPVGARLCYSSLNGDLFVFDAQSEETYSLGNGTDPAWTPDGTSLVVVRKETQHDTLVNSDLYEIPYDGKETVRLTETNDIFETDPSVESGDAILFSDYSNSTIYKGSLDKTLKVNSIIKIESKKVISTGTRQESFQETESTLPGKIPNAATHFEVPYTNQVYDTPYGYGSLGSSACGPTSAIMVIAYYNLLPPWNLSIVYPTRHISAYGNYVLAPYHFHGVYFSGGGYGYMWNSSDPYHMMVSYYKYHGLTASELDAPSLDTVIGEVSAGYPYSLCNGLTSAGHIIVINGVGSQKGTLIVNDPYGNKNSGSYPSYNGKDVQYDWPGYNNGNQNLNNAYWGVSVRYTAPAVCDSIVDDIQFNDGFTLDNAKPASMSLWLDRNSGYDGHEWCTYSRHSDTCTAQWRPALTRDGNYEVSAYIAYGTARAARYRIFYDGDSATVVLDQSQYKNSWALLGTYPFAKGDSGYVKLGDGSDSVGQIVAFDAIRWGYRNSLTSVPTQITLEQNYPNPFNPTTVISYSIPRAGFVSIEIHNVLGERVSTLVEGTQQAGTHFVDFEGSKFSSGVYFYSLKWENQISVKKMLLLK